MEMGKGDIVMQRRNLVAALVLVAAAALALEAAAPVNIKLATFVPERSTWHKALQEMGAKWTKATEGRVRLTIYAGGTLGTEAEALKRMRPGIDQLQAALLTQPGLASLDESFDVFGIPFFFQSNEELEHVVEKMTPLIRQRLELKGYHLIHWGNAGWVQLFSKQAIKTLDDVKKAKLFTSEGDDKMVQWYRSRGFDPVPLAISDIPAQLKLATGMIDAAPAPPYGALALQFYRDAPYMLEISIAPLVGATVVTDAAWRKIAEADRAKMHEIAAETERSLAQAVPKLDAESVAEMQRTGLTVTRVSGAQLDEFRKAAAGLASTMRGNMVPAEIYDLGVKYRDEFRQAKGGKR
jgi:TRAP-type C4-dicarboxylate transport system substrate-binding protein